MRILYAVSEIFPFSKTGGLADVAGALPASLARLGHDVRVVAPDYPMVRRGEGNLEPVDSLSVTLSGKSFKFDLSKSLLPGSPVEVLFLGNGDLFNRPGLYQEKGRDYPDNHLRFAAFSRAALEVPGLTGWKPDIIHGNDWQTALMFPYLKFLGEGSPSFPGAGTVFTVHNLGYQGVFPYKAFLDIGLPPELFTLNGLEFFGQVNFLKAGLIYSDFLTVVSPTYAREILTPQYGYGLEGLLKTREADLFGIVNGVDYGRWDPRRDPYIPKGYGPSDLKGKRECKSSLQKECGLRVGDFPVLGMVARLTREKGLRLLLGAFDELMRLDIQLIILGTGDPEIEEDIRRAAVLHPQKVFLRTVFDEGLAHRIEAGSDLFLMPSLYEPCGLNQLYSMRYGTIPIVRRTGGLADTVTDAQPSRLKSGEATGFVFSGTEPGDLVNAVSLALSVYSNRNRWYKMVRRAMSADFSWDRSAREYESVYDKALEKAGARKENMGKKKVRPRKKEGKI